MAFISGFIKDVGEGFFGTDFVRDYKHASRVFVADTHALAPRNKFLFHVFFEINTVAVPSLSSLYPSAERSNLGLLVKSIDLPSYDIETEQLNQYNRSRIIQKKIKYNPINIVFHDDGADYTRKLWHNYYTYYYGDSQSTNDRFAEDRDIYELNQARNGLWGLQGEPYGQQATIAPGVKLPFFRSIVVYALNQKRFVAYELINPIITNWKHDTYDYSEGGGVMENTMALEYEFVRYYDIDSARNIAGFADPSHYDVAPSPIGAMGNALTILGPGGVIDSVGSIAEDLASGNILGAIRTAGRLKQSSKGADFRDIVKQETIGVIRETARNPPAMFVDKLRPSGAVFPSENRKK